MDAMKFAVLDLETIPCQSLPAECLPVFDESTVAVGNLKDPFKIREKLDEARTKFDADLDKRLSVDPDYCEVCCAVVTVVTDSSPGGETFWWTNQPDSELRLIIAVWDWISTMARNGIPIVTFNGSSFDLPVLVKRAMYNDVSVSPHLIKSLMARQEYNSSHYDLMQLLAQRSPFSGKLEARKLNFYLKRFGIGSKSVGLIASAPTEIDDGSMVYPAWKEGRMEAIVEYCKQDVFQTAELFRRVAPWLIAPAAKREAK